MRIDQLTFTRFLGAFLIIAFHFGKTFYPYNTEALSFLVIQANVAVSYFFILSGFVMIIAYGNKPKFSIIEYFKNRFARIYPAYFLALLLMFYYLVLQYPVLDCSIFVINIFAIQAWISGSALSINPPGWSISAEFFFYTIFPFILIHIYNKISFKKVAVAIILFWLVFQILFTIAIFSGLYHGYPSKSHDFLYCFPLMHLNEFLIGNLAGLFFLKTHKEISGNYDWHILILIVLILVALKYPFGLNYHDGLMAIFFVPLILLISINTGSLTKIATKKPIVFLGEISYGVYIFQWPIYFWTFKLFTYFNIMSHTYVWFYTALFFLLTTASLSYIFIEMPFRRFVKKISPKDNADKSITL